MKQMSLTTVAIAASTFACAALLSFGWSEQRGLARRQNRRAAYGAGVVGAGAAALGTAAAVAATSPNWGWGGAPYRTGTGYYAGGPYYGGPVRGARAAYYGGYAGVGASPVVWTGGVSSSDRALYIRNLHDSGYDTKKNFNASG